MAYNTARLEKYLDYVDCFLDVDRVRIKDAPKRGINTLYVQSHYH